MTIIFSFLITVSLLMHALPVHYVSSTTVSVGDTVTYTIEVPVTMIESLQPTFNGLEVTEPIMERRPTSNAHQFKLQVFSVDNVMIPTMSITDVNGFEPLDLPPIYFNLVSLLSPTMNQINDIDPLFSLVYINWIIVVAALTMAIVLGIGVYTWRNRQKAKIMVAHEEKRQPPIVIAMNDINQLKQQLTNDPEKIKEGYFKLTEIFCRYITHTTTINVLDATTVEMHRLLKHSKRVSPNMVQGIINVSKEMDHYKFSPSPELNKASIETVIEKVVALIRGAQQ